MTETVIYWIGQRLVVTHQSTEAHPGGKYADGRTENDQPRVTFTHVEAARFSFN